MVSGKAALHPCACYGFRPFSWQSQSYCLFDREEWYGSCRLYHVRIELTRRTVINEYHQDPRKVFAMHNAVYPLSQELLDIPRPEHPKEKVVTFLGRITMQKGPEYFVEAAALVLQRTRNIRFVMAGSGDMLNAMINLVAERGIADRFHFPAS